MRYTLELGAPIPVTSIVVDGVRIVNPSDSLVDDHDLGYAVVDAPCPAFDSSTAHTPTCTWELVEGEIRKVWVLHPKTEEELEAEAQATAFSAVQGQIDAINAEFATWKATPIMYTDGHAYNPTWITEYYNSMMIRPSVVFPAQVMDASGVNSAMTEVEFTALFDFMLSASNEKIANVNARLEPLYAQVRALAEGQSNG